MLLDLGVGHDDTSLQTNTGSDLASGSDNDIGSDAGEGEERGGVRTSWSVAKDRGGEQTGR